MSCTLFSSSWREIYAELQSSTWHQFPCKQVLRMKLRRWLLSFLCKEGREDKGHHHHFSLYHTYCVAPTALTKKYVKYLRELEEFSQEGTSCQNTSIMVLVATLLFSCCRAWNAHHWRTWHVCGHWKHAQPQLRCVLHRTATHQSFLAA